MADSDIIPGPGEPGFNPDDWEECEEEEVPFVLWWRVIATAVAIGLVGAFFWFLEEHKKRQHGGKKEEKEASPTPNEHLTLLQSDSQSATDGHAPEIVVQPATPATPEEDFAKKRWERKSDVQANSESVANHTAAEVTIEESAESEFQVALKKDNAAVKPQAEVISTSKLIETVTEQNNTQALPSVAQTAPMEVDQSLEVMDISTPDSTQPMEISEQSVNEEEPMQLQASKGALQDAVIRDSDGELFVSQDIANEQASEQRAEEESRSKTEVEKANDSDNKAESAAKSISASHDIQLTPVETAACKPAQDNAESFEKAEIDLKTPQTSELLNAPDTAETLMHTSVTETLTGSESTLSPVDNAEPISSSYTELQSSQDEILSDATAKSFPEDSEVTNLIIKPAKLTTTTDTESIPSHEEATSTGKSVPEDGNETQLVFKPISSQGNEEELSSFTKEEAAADVFRSEVQDTGDTKQALSKPKDPLEEEQVLISNEKAFSSIQSVSDDTNKTTELLIKPKVSSSPLVVEENNQQVINQDLIKNDEIGEGQPTSPPVVAVPETTVENQLKAKTEPIHSEDQPEAEVANLVQLLKETDHEQPAETTKPGIKAETVSQQNEDNQASSNKIDSSKTEVKLEADNAKKGESSTIDANKAEITVDVTQAAEPESTKEVGKEEAKAGAKPSFIKQKSKSPSPGSKSSASSKSSRKSPEPGTKQPMTPAALKHKQAARLSPRGDENGSIIKPNKKEATPDKDTKESNESKKGNDKANYEEATASELAKKGKDKKLQEKEEPQSAASKKRSENETKKTVKKQPSDATTTSFSLGDGLSTDDSFRQNQVPDTQRHNINQELDKVQERVLPHDENKQADSRQKSLTPSSADDQPSVTTAPEIETYAEEVEPAIAAPISPNPATTHLHIDLGGNEKQAHPIEVDFAVTTSSPSSPVSSEERLSSMLEVLGATSTMEALMKVKTLQEISDVMRRAGLQSSNLIFGIDYTASNKYQGEYSFDGKSLHSIATGSLNPYQQVIMIMGKTLAPFATSGYIPAFGFGDIHTSDWSVFPFKREQLCQDFDEVLDVYNQITPKVILSGPTNFAPLIYQSVDICRQVKDYHILVIVADGQVTNERATRRAIVDACKFPLSIIVVGVGDGPWEMMRVFDESLPKRPWDNFHFVEFHKLMKEAAEHQADLSFAIESLIEVPDQYKKIKALGLLDPEE